MSITHLPQTHSLEIKIKKQIQNDQTPSALIYHYGFNDELKDFLDYFGLNDIKAHSTNKELCLINEPFNGLIFSTSYLSQLFPYHKHHERNFIFDKLIYSQGLVREIPVLFSAINLEGFDNSELKKYQRFLQENFDNVYTLHTNRSLSTNNEILADNVDKTKKIYSAKNHPIHKFKEQMRKTYQISFELL